MLSLFQKDPFRRHSKFPAAAEIGCGVVSRGRIRRTITTLVLRQIWAKCLDPFLAHFGSRCTSSRAAGWFSESKRARKLVLDRSCMWTSFVRARRHLLPKTPVNASNELIGKGQLNLVYCATDLYRLACSKTVRLWSVSRFHVATFEPSFKRCDGFSRAAFPAERHACAFVLPICNPETDQYGNRGSRNNVLIWWSPFKRCCLPTLSGGQGVASACITGKRWL